MKQNSFVESENSSRISISNNDKINLTEIRKKVF